MEIKKKIRSKIIHCKIFIQRSMSYVSIINSGMILFLFISKLEDYEININIKKWFLPMYIFSILFMILLGYTEDKLGFFKEEVKAGNKRNEILNKINNKLNIIEKKY